MTTATKRYQTLQTAKAAIARRHKDQAVEIELLCHLAGREYSADVRDKQTREIIASYRLRKTMYGVEIV